MWKGRSEWSLKALDGYWPAEKSIYSFLVGQLDPVTAKLADSGIELPRETPYAPGRLKWAAGALDGVMGRHSSKGDNHKELLAMGGALEALVARPNPRNLDALRRSLEDSSVSGYIDELLNWLTHRERIRVDHTALLATWLARRSPFPEVLKIAIALLGRCPDIDNNDQIKELLLVLGAHEEFTLYAAVALQNRFENGEQLLFELAQKVTGWGRVHLVDQLWETSDPSVRRWLLLEGYKNDVMWEYTALECAKGGQLANELRQLQISDEVYEAAGDLLTTLIGGIDGPAACIHDFEEAPEALNSYLQHAKGRSLVVHSYNNLHEIRDFLRDLNSGAEIDEESSLKLVRQETISDLLRDADELLAKADLESEIRSVLSDAKQKCHAALQAARLARLDVWDLILVRVQNGDLGVSRLLPTSVPERLQRALQIASPLLDRLNAAPDATLIPGAGGPWREFTEISMMLQALTGPWPVMKEFLMKALDCPHMAVQRTALEAARRAGSAECPADVIARIELLASKHTDSKTRELARSIASALSQS